MGSCCARCMKFGEWKKYRGQGSYKGRNLCTMCKLVVTKPRNKTKKVTDNHGRDRQRHVDKVSNR